MAIAVAFHPQILSALGRVDRPCSPYRLLYIEHRQSLGKNMLLIRWSTSQPIIQGHTRRLLAVPLFSGTFTLSDRSESTTVACVCIADETLRSGVGLLLTRGAPQMEDIKMLIVIGELHGRISAQEADAAIRARGQRYSSSEIPSLFQTPKTL